MSEKILVPVLGESLNEATVSKWLKNVGDFVNSDEAIVELETDKVNLEVPASISGILSEINSKEGQTVTVGSVLGSISDSKGKTNEKEKEEPKNIEPLEEKKIFSNDEIIKDQEDYKEDSSIQTEPLILNEEEEPKISNEEEPLILKEEVDIEDKKLKPLEKNMDINKIKGTGRDGRILKGDLIALMGENPQPNQRKIKYGEEERIKMTRLRQTIAKRLKEAQENAAMLTTFNEIDMSGIISMRKENQEDFKNRYNIKLGFMSFFVKACVVGLKLFPAINAEIEGQDIIYKNYYNISFAVGTVKGLVVPVIRNADEL